MKARDEERAREIAKKIVEREREIEKLKKEYLEIVPPCENISCRHFTSQYVVQCDLYKLVTYCDRYIAKR